MPPRVASFVLLKSADMSSVSGSDYVLSQRTCAKTADLARSWVSGFARAESADFKSFVLIQRIRANPVTLERTFSQHM